MKANILDTARKKRLLKAEANRLLDNEAVKRCRKCQREMAKEADSMSKTHAALQSMHFLEITANALRRICETALLLPRWKRRLRKKALSLRTTKLRCSESSSEFTKKVLFMIRV